MKTKKYAVCLFITKVEVDDDDDDDFENDKHPTLSLHDTLESAQDALVDVITYHDEIKMSVFSEKMVDFL